MDTTNENGQPSEQPIENKAVLEFPEQSDLSVSQKVERKRVREGGKALAITQHFKLPEQSHFQHASP